ncbi:hypothetical protein [Paraburkholderia susongensis]|uniref:Uncharacterized protein n=1 Tax=Paraburkholderia susongensis TaxID=1515439 RepID=A0A1X7IFR8_9BURK|nr:hypothetical protein [Paraburkholderia susongensis]SMG13581.1 hypothetical protein SAMN06265784_101656 [Paraburkholderia susongensis]
MVNNQVLLAQADKTVADQECSMYDLMTLEVVNKDGGGDAALCFRIADRSALLRTEDVDELIRQLVLVRVSMTPPPSVEPVKTQDYPLEIDPSWHVDHSPLLGAVLLLRHAGSGWTAYALPDQSVQRLVQALSAKPPVSRAPDVLLN